MVTRTAATGSKQRRMNTNRRHQEDDRTPALRLAVPKCVPAVDLPGKTDKLPDPTEIRKAELLTRQPLAPFDIGETVEFDFLDHAQRIRNSSDEKHHDPAPLERQVVEIPDYDRARRHEPPAPRGVRRIPPQRLAVYTIVVVLLLALVAVAGLQALQSGDVPTSSESGIVLE